MKGRILCLKLPGLEECGEFFAGLFGCEIGREPGIPKLSFHCYPFLDFDMVGAARFELATSSPPEKRSTKLSHAPTFDMIPPPVKSGPGGTKKPSP